MVERLPVRHAETGFTLVELMIVIVFVAVGVLALSGIQTHSYKDVYTTGRRTRALELAKTQAEISRSDGYLNASPDSGQVGIYTWNTAVDSVGVGFLRVTVNVNWNESGNPQNVQIVDLLSAR
jgi:Tfp pilus assembly protein PilV